jgi:hypothetical protein
LQDVKSDSTFRIPLIDFSKYREATSLSEKRRTAGLSPFVLSAVLYPTYRNFALDDIVSGFKEVGFVYLSGHGINSHTVKNTFKRVRYFFNT